MTVSNIPSLLAYFVFCSLAHNGQGSNVQGLKRHHKRRFKCMFLTDTFNIKCVHLMGCLVQTDK